jgi:hypothetical protein
MSQKKTGADNEVTPLFFLVGYATKIVAKPVFVAGVVRHMGSYSSPQKSYIK